MREVDRRSPRTELTKESWWPTSAYPTPQDSFRIVYKRDVPRLSIATVGPIVQRAGNHGDGVAMQILERAAEELVLAAASVASRLEMRGDGFSFLLAGGVFRVVPWLVEELGRGLIEVAPRANVKVLIEEPAVDAVSLALAHARHGADLPRYA